MLSFVAIVLILCMSYFMMKNNQEEVFNTKELVFKAYDLEELHQFFNR